MRTRLFDRTTPRIPRLGAILVIFSCAAATAEDTGSREPVSEPPPGKEEALKLPAYPDKDRLVEVPASQSGDGFRVFIDPDSLSVGSDRVVRYTLVITSSSGVSNTSYEGLHCGTRAYRRYAYGSNGAWHTIEASPWQRVADSGRNDYHYVLYWNFLCDPVQTNRDVADMLRRIRHPAASVLHD